MPEKGRAAQRGGVLSERGAHSGDDRLFARTVEPKRVRSVLYVPPEVHGGQLRKHGMDEAGQGVRVQRGRNGGDHRQPRLRRERGGQKDLPERGPHRAAGRPEGHPDLHQKNRRHHRGQARAVRREILTNFLRRISFFNT